MCRLKRNWLFAVCVCLVRGINYTSHLMDYTETAEEEDETGGWSGEGRGSLQQLGQRGDESECDH